MTRVLSVASECVPFVKTGGLADVAGALPRALAGDGVEMATLLPGYPAVMAALPAGAAEVVRLPELFGGWARVVRARAAGIDLMALDAPHLYDRPGGLYLGPDGRDWPDNPERFAALCIAAARIAADGAAGWRPDLVHLHDWQAGWTPIYAKAFGAGAVPMIVTVHNIAFQGLAPAAKRVDLGLPEDGFNPEGYEYWGRISALKAGLVGADAITTVSPTYARELMTPEYGLGLDGVLRSRAADLRGILNGIDLDLWNPADDPALEASYDTPAGKAPNRAALREAMGLPEAEGPLCAVVSRLTAQKGIDLVLAALPTLLARGGQLAVLGSGEPALEEALMRMAESQPGVAARIGYDEDFSHRTIAGADALLVPSRFEPCGLTQLYALRYGTVPLVARTGGLADTVIDANPVALRAGVATGVQFSPVTAEALAAALDRLCDLHAMPETWAEMQANGMAQPVGWPASAADYAALYRELFQAR